MLRTILRQTLPFVRGATPRAALNTVILHPRFVAVRFESNQGNTSPEAHQRRQQLQADWVAPKLTYEDVKRRTQHPTEVFIGPKYYLCTAPLTMS